MKEVITEKAKTIIIIHIQTHNNKKVIIKVNWLEEKSKKIHKKCKKNYKSCLNKIKMLLNCPPLLPRPQAQNFLKRMKILKQKLKLIKYL